MLRHEEDTLVIGTGCAGWNAADWLYDFGLQAAVITEGRKMGTSRHTGSDKQTYYKLSLTANEMDSIGEMARTLASGIGVNGDTALVEAACSLRCFFKLANLGVPFPTNEYGEYVGYKTDHDPRSRATSAGPLTSKYMTESLEKNVERKGIRVYDAVTVIKIITRDGAVAGALGVDKHNRFHLFSCSNLILATGGPAAVYQASVYPISQSGMTGIALEAGAKAANLQEWQYGMASIKFRWNVSGTYQQVLPRYVSVDSSGEEHEFLNDYFDDPFQAVSLEFLKGYQWPFDMRKVGGSSQLDLIVHHEIFDKGRRVYLDFRRNPSCIEREGFGRLDKEAFVYLEKSGALFGTPIERLEKMNRKAIDLYLGHRIDLYREPLEIAVCAQHCNGGIAVDSNWETNIRGLYAAGEAAGTFGVYRPGGSALNSTQVGSLRAAEHIAQKKSARNTAADFEYLLKEAQAFLEPVLNNSRQQETNPWKRRMSACAAQIRDQEKMLCLQRELTEEMQRPMPAFRLWRDTFKYRDMMITQIAVLDAMRLAAGHFGSRGSALIRSGKESGEGVPVSGHLKEYKYQKQKPVEENDIVTTVWDGKTAGSYLEAARPIPEGEHWFETVWNSYIKRTNQRGKTPEKKEEER